MGRADGHDGGHDEKGIAVPQDVFEALKTVRGKIESGCFSPCEVGCDLAVAEGPLFSQGYLLDQNDFQQWSDLLGEAMQGKLDYQAMMGIPAFDPVKTIAASSAASAGRSLEQRGAQRQCYAKA